MLADEAKNFSSNRLQNLFQQQKIHRNQCINGLMLYYTSAELNYCV